MNDFKIKILYIIQWLVKFIFSFFSKKNQLNHNSYNSIAILCGAGIGDAVMATPIIETIKLNNEKIKLTVICTSINADVFKYNPFVSNQIIYKKTFSSLLKTCCLLVYNKIDVFIGSQPSNTIAHSLFAFFSCAKIKAKINKNYIHDYLNYNFLYDILISNNMNRHRVQLNLEIVNSLGFSKISLTNNQCKMYVGDIYTYSKIYGCLDYVVVHLGSGEKTKLWPSKNFSQIINHIINKNKSVIVVGGINERSQFLEIQKKQIQKIINLIGKLTLIELSVLLQNSFLLITNDTGVMHIAATTNTKILALYGSTNPQHIGPFSNYSTIIKKNNINDISVEEVVNLIDKCLDE